MVLARVVDEHRRRLDHRRAVLQILVEEGLEHVAAEFERGIAIPLERPEIIGVVIDLAVPPRPHHQMVVAGETLGLQRGPGRDRAVHILLVEQALQPHRRHARRIGGDEQLVERLALPEGVVGRVGREPAPERQLIEAVRHRIVPGRARLQQIIIVVEPRIAERRPLALRRGLAGEIAEIDVSERAVVEPIVPHPAVDHRTFGGGDLQRGVRRQQRHRHREPLVGGADHAHLAVRLGQILHQPVDRVIGVGDVIGIGGVERPTHRARHHIVALRAIFAAHVLEHADVAVAHEHLVALRQRGEHRQALGAAGAAIGIVGGARQQDRRAAGALRDYDHGVELHPVAHRHLDHALDVIGLVQRRDERLRDVAADRPHRRGRGWCCGDQQRQRGKPQGDRLQHGITPLHRAPWRSGGRPAPARTSAPGDS